VILAHDIIEAILQREGSTFTDRPDDRGGPTCCGITLETYTAFRAPQPTTIEDLKALAQDLATARRVYEHVYIDVPGFGQIAHPALEALMVDAGVQHGTEEASKMIQRAVGAVADGHLGPVSLAAINSHEVRALYVLVCGARIRLYGSLVAHDAQLAKAKLAGYALQADNALGWANRIAQFVEVIP
jgi:lysozyme family protein